MATNLQIQNRVKELMIDSNAEADAHVQRWVNRAFEILQDAYEWRIQEEETATATAEDTRKLMDLPSDFSIPRAQPYYIDGAGGHKMMDWLSSQNDLAMLYDDAATDKGSPKHLLINPKDDDDFQIDVYPLPDALNVSGAVYSDGNYRIVIPYWSKIPDMSADADTNWFTVNGNDFIEAKAAAFGLRFLRDHDEALIQEAVAAAELRRLKNIDKKWRLREMTSIPVRTDVHGTSAQERP